MSGGFGEVRSPWWPTVYVVGGGPSLRERIGPPPAPGGGAVPESLPWKIAARDDGYVLGVNRAAELLGPLNVDATFSIDREFIRRYAAQLAEWGRDHEVYLGVSEGWFRNERSIPGATYLVRRTGVALSDDPRAIANGLSSGYGALNLALLKGAREVYLLGFDSIPPARDEPHHWHSGYSWFTGSSIKYWERWAAKYDALAEELPKKFPGARVFNVNPESAIRAFPFRSYEELGL